MVSFSRVNAQSDCMLSLSDGSRLEEPFLSRTVTSVSGKNLNDGYLDRYNGHCNRLFPNDTTVILNEISQLIICYAPI